MFFDANFQIIFELRLRTCRIHGNRRCLGCCTKGSFVTADNKPIEGPGKGQETNKPSILEDYYSSSPNEMDYSVPQSQISASSTSNMAADAQCSNSSEFVNHGLLLWHQTRQQWVADKAHEKNKKAREPVISWAIRWNATYDSLLGTNKPFTRPIPLPEMVNFLVDIWEQDGMYD